MKVELFMMPEDIIHTSIYVIYPVVDVSTTTSLRPVLTAIPRPHQEGPATWYRMRDVSYHGRLYFSMKVTATSMYSFRSNITASLWARRIKGELCRQGKVRYEITGYSTISPRRATGKRVSPLIDSLRG
ncbi:hypothetical protein VFPPC_17524 [Pochonia chlamydosporia 170]|uniref:Uncharacterized protein n=1 Tax=Pochonia chlamydosporia 170 TaxID=1380566 RepID=A0A219ARA3_METCM|nr:hypothetical protein VFPPC_17524 [Pochonia chlamydosporia 170]OWT43313.1 hypothetical protein VFPPC_17524 [Pochonia chlamydosporia 170]